MGENYEIVDVVDGNTDLGWSIIQPSNVETTENSTASPTNNNETDTVMILKVLKNLKRECRKEREVSNFDKFFYFCMMVFTALIIVVAVKQCFKVDLEIAVELEPTTCPPTTDSFLPSVYESNLRWTAMSAHLDTLLDKRYNTVREELDLANLEKEIEVSIDWTPEKQWQINVLLYGNGKPKMYNFYHSEDGPVEIDVLPNHHKKLFRFSPKTERPTFFDRINDVLNFILNIAHLNL